MTINIQQRGLGVAVTAGRAQVNLWAPAARTAAIKLLPGNEVIALERGVRGYWTSHLQAAPGTQYWFVIDGTAELPDPASLYQPEGVHGPSAIFDTGAFQWTDKEWVNPSLEEYIFYELHTGTFSEEGTFEGIEAKLDHLLACGVTAVQIMPVSQFPGCRNWGYDGVLPFAVQDSYGGPAMLQRLVNACHKKGLAVVLDVVYNHMGPEGNYLRHYGPYFTPKYGTPWGEAVNFDDAGCDEVRKYFIENALMWLRDFHIDALRLDAVHALKDMSPRHILRDIKEHVNELMAHTGRTHYLIAESDLNDPRYINPLHENGYGMDAQWNDDFHHALRVTAVQETMGYYADFNGLEHLAKAYRDAYVYDEKYSVHRQKTYGAKTSNPGRQFVVFTQNHDQTGNRLRGERTSALLSFEMLKVTAAAVLLSPFLPMLFMGEEWGEPNPFHYFISHSDEELVMAVRKGRAGEFASFCTDGVGPDPQEDNTFNCSKLQWNLLHEPRHQALFSFYKTLIALRKRHPALVPDRKNISVTTLVDQQVLTLHRWSGHEHMVCFMNFSKETQTITPGSVFVGFKAEVDSAAAEWGGKGGNAPALLNGASLNIQPQSILIYTYSHV
ncbi:MAG: malto-oligosyltrehalose trehalohydrolase [Taibaiella sp.]|nr:malto-oligosyltrehalose trehalohydrolase [Taibaiella sp.]